MGYTLADFRAAQARIKGLVRRTPMMMAGPVTTGPDLALKLEYLQITGSFKPRGAFVKIHNLTEAQRQAGVIAMSAGNHAQGVAFWAGRLGIPAVIVMPKATPFSKVERTSAYGAKIELQGANLSEAADHAEKLAARDGLTFVHPYDDPHVIAGQEIGRAHV